MYDHHITNMARMLSQRLAEKIQVESQEIAEALREYWSDFAVHVWHTADVIFQADQMALPMSQKAAREILKNVEDKIDCEYGLTWSTIDEAIQKWGDKISWPDLSDEELAMYSGSFVLAWHSPRLIKDIHNVVKSDNLLDAVQQARQMAERNFVDVRVIATEPFEDNDDPQSVAEVGNTLMIIQNPHKEKKP